MVLVFIWTFPGNWVVQMYKIDFNRMDMCEYMFINHAEVE